MKNYWILEETITGEKIEVEAFDKENWLFGGIRCSLIPSRENSNLKVFWMGGKKYLRWIVEYYKETNKLIKVSLWGVFQNSTKQLATYKRRERTSFVEQE